jgi:hypothetical protein
MVWPITGAESYVRETGKSMYAMELAVAHGRRRFFFKQLGCNPQRFYFLFDSQDFPV